MGKIRISALTRKSEVALAKAMSNDDLFLMATMGSDVRKGACTVELYRAIEKQMVEKYGFAVK